MKAWNWRIYSNPLFRKSVFNRLRLKPTVAWGAVTFIMALFIFMIAYVATVRRDALDAHEAAGTCIISLLVLQGIILMFMGTGSVAHGVAEERENGLIDYQRLNPMRRSDKILGYLFGLPVREYFLFAITVPFTLFAAIGGGVNLLRLGRLYMVFFTLVIVYHLTGYVAGMIATRPRRASWFSRAAIIVLYLLLPQIANIGFTIFGFLTIFPTAYEVAAVEWGTDFVANDTWRTAPFFGLELNPTLFTMALQVMIVATYVAILMRKWLHDAKQALSKWQSLAAFIGVQILILGSLSPVLKNPTRLTVLAMALRQEAPMEAAREVLTGIFYAYWGLTVVVAAMVLNTVTPDPDGLIVGMRRAQKRGLKKPALGADKGSSLWVAIAVGVVGACSYGVLFYLTRDQSQHYGTIQMTPAVLLPAAIFFFVVLTIQGIRQKYGGRGLFLAVFLVGIVPGMVSIVLVAAFSSATAALYLGLPSPAVSLGVASMYAFGIGALGETAPYAWAGLFVSAALAAVAWRGQHRVTSRAREIVFGK